MNWHIFRYHHMKIKKSWVHFNAWRLKTVALTFTEINFSQCEIKLWTSGLKSSRALEGYTYITKTLPHPTKLCMFQWTSQCDSLKFSFSILKESLRKIHTVGLFSPIVWISLKLFYWNYSMLKFSLFCSAFVKRFGLKLLHFLQIWHIEIHCGPRKQKKPRPLNWIHHNFWSS